MEEGKDSEQTQWVSESTGSGHFKANSSQRIEPMGWDSDDRTYFVLDDNRVYRMTDAPLEVPPPKKKSKSSRKSGRASKRRRVSAAQAAAEAEDSDAQDSELAVQPEAEDDGFGGIKWECLAVTLDEVRNLIASFRKTRDENEKILRDQLEEHLLPILEKQEESRKRKELNRERELLSLAKMANAKRSSRLANKQEQQKEEEKAREDEQRRRAEEIAEKKAERQRIKLERERDERLMSRENRLKEREARRQLHEDELANLSEDSRQTGDVSGRMSERRLQAEITKRKQALEALAAEDEEEDDWIFDCVCGVYGQVDDGTHSVACERCNVWQHSKCIGVSEDEAEQSDFHFVCSTCRRREEDAKSKPRPTTIKLKVGRPDDGHSSPSSRPQTTSSEAVTAGVSHPETEGHASHQQPAAVEPTNDVTMTDDDNVPQYGQSSSFKVAPSTAEDSRKSPGPDSEPSLPAHAGSNANGSGPRATGASGDDTKTNGPLPVTPGFSLGRKNNGMSLPFSSPSKSSAGRPASRSPTRDFGVMSSPIMGGASLLATPGLDRESKNGEARQPSTLPSSEAGHSPTKHSPAVARPESASSAFSRTSNFPAVFPPLTTLAPSPRQPILTPPTKQPEPSRPPPPEFTKPSEA